MHDDNPHTSRVLLGWIDSRHHEVLLLGDHEDDLIAELAEAYPDAEMRALIGRGTDGRVGRPLLTAGGLYAARYLAAVVMSRARQELDPDSRLATPRGAMRVVLQAMSDRFGRRAGELMRSYAVIGRRLAAEIYSGITDSLRLYRPQPVTEERLVDGMAANDALRTVCEAGGHEVLAPELQDGSDAIAALLAFLSDESHKSDCRWVDVLAAVVSIMRESLQRGWDVGGRLREPITTWTQFDRAVATAIEQRRTKTAC